MELDLNELERRAKSAGGQEWTLTIDATGDAFLSEKNGEYVAEVGAVGEDGIVSDYGKFIAAANPAVVLELVRRLREAETRVAVLEAERTEREKQEPVAWMNEKNSFICKDPKNADFCVPLYAAPPVTSLDVPVFWYRPHDYGPRYDGPLHDSQIEQVQRESGAWVPLFAKPIQPARGEG